MRRSFLVLTLAGCLPGTDDLAPARRPARRIMNTQHLHQLNLKGYGVSLLGMTLGGEGKPTANIYPIFEDLKKELKNETASPES